MTTQYAHLVSSTGAINRAAVMLMAHERNRREAARYVKAGIAAPSYRTLFAHELAEVAAWAKAMQRGIRNGQYGHSAVLARIPLAA